MTNNIGDIGQKSPRRGKRTMKQIMSLKEDKRELKVHQGLIDGKETIVFHYTDILTGDDLTVSCSIRR